MKKLAKRALVVPIIALIFILGTMSVAFAASSSGSTGMPEGLAAQIDQGSTAATLKLPEGTQRAEDATVAVVVTPPATTVAGQQTTPTVVAAQQTSPATGVTRLPATATDNATSMALLATGLAALIAGLILGSRRLVR